VIEYSQQPATRTLNVTFLISEKEPLPNYKIQGYATYNSIPLRHWKATIEYHQTKDILYFMKMLGHKNIQNTLIYTQLITFESDECYSAVAKTIDEARARVEEGFQYVCTHNDVILFRKRK
jgi:hypothetical protein